MTPAEHQAEEADQQKDLQDFRAAGQLLEPESPWNTLLAPIFKDELEKLEEVILSGECANWDNYVAACGNRQALLKCVEAPQRIRSASKENMDKRRVRIGGMEEEG